MSIMPRKSLPRNLFPRLAFLMLVATYSSAMVASVNAADATDTAGRSARAATSALNGEVETQRVGGLAPVAAINAHLREAWGQYGLKPSPTATDGEWCRRVYLDLIGRVPSVSELLDFTRDRATDKRSVLVDHLLESEDYIEEYARNWTTIWTNVLIGRSGGMGDDEMASRSGMQKYLRDSFARNKPYDRMVYELISATGTTKPGSEQFNGAVNFLANKMDENGVQAAAKMSFYVEPSTKRVERSCRPP